jgi:hypothetical protein
MSQNNSFAFVGAQQAAPFPKKTVLGGITNGKDQV